MYAVVISGGKQHKVEVGSVLKTELETAKVGEKVELQAIMLADDKKLVVGDAAKKVKVVAEVLEHGKDKKIVVFKYKPKKNERKKQGHRQPYTKLKIVSIEG